MNKYTYERGVLLVKQEIPLLNQPYIYVDQDCSSFTNGNTYKVIGTGQHWHREFGFCVWMTNDEYPDTKDEDYGTSIGIDEFSKCFWKV